MSTEGGPAAPATGDSLGTGENGEIVGGPRTPQQIAAQKRVQQTQAQVDEVVGIMRVNVERVLERDQKLSELDYRAVFLFPQVVDIMRTNVEKVLERDQKLSELDDRADALQQGASQFEQQAGKLKRKMWWKNLKMMIIMGVIGLIVFIIIVGK
ncbi:Synaptobrevin [Armadillidium vulgare]|nr:Synaptobrevin [Armadillidium vulgare]